MIRLGALAVGLLFVINVLWGAIAPREDAAPDMAKQLHKHPKHVEWTHNGPGNLGIFGTFDRGQLQRGFQVYKEVCSACHAMRQLSYRNLLEIGLTEAQVRNIAAQFQVVDGPNDQGEMFERPARLSDRFRRQVAVVLDQVIIDDDLGSESARLAAVAESSFGAPMRAQR